MAISTSNILEVHATVAIVVPDLVDLRLHGGLQVPADGLGNRGAGIERDACEGDEWDESLFEISAAQRRFDSGRHNGPVALGLEHIKVALEEFRVLDRVQGAEVLGWDGSHERQEGGEDAELHGCKRLVWFGSVFDK